MRGSAPPPNPPQPARATARRAARSPLRAPARVPNLRARAGHRGDEAALADIGQPHQHRVSQKPRLEQQRAPLAGAAGLARPRRGAPRLGRHRRAAAAAGAAGRDGQQLAFR
jgi:hypothetical protein